jgi:pyruvate decarboxylase
VMGLPGDTNLELLHYIGSTDMHWGETSNSAERDVESLNSKSEIRTSLTLLVLSMDTRELKGVLASVRAVLFHVSGGD